MCTTFLAGKKATYDGSTLMARNEDSGPGHFTEKKFVVINPEQQPRLYKSVISKVEIKLPDNPMRYTSMPNAFEEKEGIWGEAGINAANVAMSETETITSNPRVIAADPLVSGGIGEEDMLTVVLPYIKSAKEGVLRLGSLLEEFGTYEKNGIGFQDLEEVWWFESIGGHHWIAKRVPDDCYAVISNQQGIDYLDLEDAFGAQKNCMCSADLIEFIENNHLNLGSDSVKGNTMFDARAAFGSHSDQDHCYNTPRVWVMERYLNRHTYFWDGPDADFTPVSDNLPWCLAPEKKVTVEDVKYVLSEYYQDTPFNPYRKKGDTSEAGIYRPVGINRNNFVAITQLRPYVPAELAGVEWISEGSNAFNGSVAFYANVTTTPAYFAATGHYISTENFFWHNRLIGCLADAHYGECVQNIERYQAKLFTEGHRFIAETDAKFASEKPENVQEFLEAANQSMSDFAQKETDKLLAKVLLTAGFNMKNAFSRADN